MKSLFDLFELQDVSASPRLAAAPRNSPAYVAAICDAIRDAEQILKRIDREWPGRAT